MKTITCYIDFISPYAALAFEELPRALQGCSYEVAYHPILFAGLLKHHGQLGPAEIPAKRTWTYRQVLWLGQHLGHRLELPAAHPFSSLPMLRLAWACAAPGCTPNRYVCERLFHHVWHGGLDAADVERLAALRAELAPTREPDDESVKSDLRLSTDAAIAAGVFGVPSFLVDGEVFFGLDSLPMLAQHIQDSGLSPVSGPQWADAAQWPVGVQRRRGP